MSVGAHGRPVPAVWAGVRPYAPRRIRAEGGGPHHGCRGEAFGRSIARGKSSPAPNASPIRWRGEMSHRRRSPALAPGRSPGTPFGPAPLRSLGSAFPNRLTASGAHRTLRLRSLSRSSSGACRSRCAGLPRKRRGRSPGGPAHPPRERRLISASAISIKSSAASSEIPLPRWASI